MTTILICDDEDAVANRLTEAVRQGLVTTEGVRTENLSGGNLRERVSDLADRQRAFRRHGSWPEDTTRLDVDQASIFVVDYDLTEQIPFLTLEMLAYAARCFSTCGIIVGVNQYSRDNPFDLTLRGHLESFADLNIAAPQLRNAYLWGGMESGLRPWYWPPLPSCLRDCDKRVEDVKQSLTDDAPIWHVIGFDAEVFRILPRSIREFIGPDPFKTTFLEFVTNSGNALDSKDSRQINDQNVVARIGAARIFKWLERWVLPAQDIVVDAPHLVSRYPSLLTGDRDDIETWNKTAQFTGHEELGLDAELIDDFRLKKEHWLSRPVWFWERLREHEGILEVREPWASTRPDWVFCEDTSRFHPRRECKEFIADVDSPFTLRFVEHIEGVNYGPRVRFSL